VYGRDDVEQGYVTMGIEVAIAGSRSVEGKFKRGWQEGMRENYRRERGVSSWYMHFVRQKIVMSISGWKRAIWANCGKTRMRVD
jgi:hypothetical protein